jgi:Acetyltransferase (GNAT) family
VTGSGLMAVPASSLAAPQLSQTEEVYRQAFAPHLRVPFADLARPGPAGLMLVALEDGKPVAFAAMLLLGQAGWTFLRYYGVAAARRRTGIGGRFWELVPPAVAAAGWPARIAFEVEDPADEAADEAERHIRLRRIAFWQRCGARLLAVGRYVMPALSAAAEPEQMRLMAYDADGPPELPAARLTSLVAGLYAERYGLEAGHPLVVAALASVTG